MKLSTVALFVSDVAAAAAFYREMLELEPIPALSSRDFAALAAGPLVLGLQLPPPGKVAGCGKIGVEAEDVDAVYERWVGRGVTIKQPIEDKPLFRTFVAEDRDGNEIRVLRFRERRA